MNTCFSKICDYGCGNISKFQLKNGKWCCSEKVSQCPAIRKKISKANKNQSERRRNISSKVHKGKIPWNKNKTGVYSIETINKMKVVRKGKTYEKIFGKEKTEIIKKKQRGIKLTISKIKKKYPFFYKIEEMRYNPDKPDKKEIQVHCKNHNCPNSKEKGGWFTPTYQQMKTRRDWLENEGVDICYLYCCEKCKNSCPLYHSKGIPFQNTIMPYTQSEYDTFRKFVLERDNYICQYCGEKAEHVHHERPQKLEPFFALDPDLAWSVCSECHYKYGHKDECSTGNLAKVIC